MNKQGNDTIDQLKSLRLFYLAENYDSFVSAATNITSRELIEKIVRLEMIEKKQRSIQMRLNAAKLGRFHRMVKFDWNWPAKIDQERIKSMLALDFMPECNNIIMVGAQGLGKTMIVKNIGVNAINRGFKVLFTTATKLVTDLLASGHNLETAMKKYIKPDLLIIDEIGYLSFELKAADLLFEVVSRRYQQNPIILTTNLAFKDWPEIFPGAACVTALVDRLTHNADILQIEGSSYRQKETKIRERKTKNGSK